jgi:hypothetical protein
MICVYFHNFRHFSLLWILSRLHVEPIQMGQMEKASLRLQTPAATTTTACIKPTLPILHIQ